jgi:hypothetical protein
MILYHGTAAALLPLILKQGLKPHGGKGADAWAMSYNPGLGISLMLDEDQNRAQSVYLASEADWALWYAKMSAEINDSEPVLLQIDLPDPARLTHDEGGGPAYRYQGKIGPEHIKPLPRDAWAYIETPDLPYSEGF